MDSHRPEVKDSLDLAREVDSLCDRFEAAWQGGERPELDAWMPAEGPLRRAALAELARLDREYRLKGGEEKTPEAPVQLPETLAFPSPGGDPQLTRKFLSEQETAPSQEKAAWPLIPGYEVLGVLGQGGMGVVYQARQMGLNRVVALKMILHAEHAGDEERRRFRAEAESIARLQHPNIVQVFEVGEHSGLPFFSLELCAGGSLAQKLNGTPLPPKEAAALVETLARAMDAAHQKGVIHRDLKPANVLLAADGAPKVTDFGLAKKLDEAGQTASGAVMGTPSYMAPEQAGGKTAALGPPCDIYALGAILYECLTGRPPFRGPSVMDTLIQVIADEPVAVRQLQPQMPADVETICLKCLRKEAGRRYESAAALADDLRRWLEGDPIKARRLPWTERAWRWTRRNPALAGVFLLLLTGVVGATAALVNIAEANSKEREARTDAETKGGENLKLAYRLRGSLDDVQTALAGKGAALSAREAEFQKARHNLYVAQLYRVAAIYERNPIEARTLLHDCNNCPIDLRDPIWHLMHNDCRRWEIGILKGHRAGVTSVAWSKDGRTLASGAQDNTVKLWDLTGGQAVRTLKGHTQLVRGVAFSSDGQTLASASWDSTVKLWDLAKDYEIRTLKGHSLAVYAVAFSSDGKHLASASHDKTVRLWDPASGQEQATLVGHTGAVYAVAFSGDGKHLASASHDKTVKLWDVAKQQVVHTFQGHEREVFGVALSSDGRTLASASADTTVRLWDVAARQPRHVLKGHSNWALAVAFSNDGKTLVTSGGDRLVKLWDSASGQERVRLQGHDHWVMGMAFNNDGSALASASEDRTVRLWRVVQGQERANLKGHTQVIRSVAFSSDSKTLASASEDQTVKLWDPATGQVRRTLHGHKGYVYTVAFSTDNQTLASAGGDRVVRLWDLTSGRERTILQGHTAGVNAVAFSGDGRTLASASEDRTVRLWDTATGRERTILRGHNTWVMAVAFSSDGRLVASGEGLTSTGGPEAVERPGEIKLWDAAQGRELRSLKGHQFSVRSLAFSGDGRTLVSASVDRTVKLWDVVSGKVQATLVGHASDVAAVAYTSDGRILASGGGDGFIKLWDAASGQHRIALPGHLLKVFALAFSNDGKTLASGGHDNVVKLWDLSPAPLLASFQGHTGGLTSLAYSPDGRTLASGSQDQTVRLWDASTGQEQAALRGHAATLTTVAFSADGHTLRSRDAEGVTKEWDLETRKQRAATGDPPKNAPAEPVSPDGRLRATVAPDGKVQLRHAATDKSVVLAEHTAAIKALVFSPDGCVLASGSDDKTIKLWDLVALGLVPQKPAAKP